MATTEERLAALEAKMAQLTDTTPTTYYTHQYSGEEIDAAVGRALTGGALDTSVTNVSNQLGTFVRPNLLDNWYFGRPVNQRGQSSYSGFGYGIDRWYIEAGAQMQIMDGFVRFSGAPSVIQKISIPETGIYTFSILYRKTGGSSGIYIHSEAGIGFLSKEFDVAQEWTLYSGSFERIENSDLYFAIYGYGDTESSVDVKAVKFEYGSHQTLVHQDVNGNWVLNEIPDYGEQLRRCQRYRIAYGQYAQWGAVDIQTDYIDFSVYLPVTMRAFPSIDGASNLRVNRYSGFVFSVAAFNGNNLRIRATKSNHGLSSAFLEAAEKIAFTSDL